MSWSVTAVWSSGMILPQGARGPGFNSQNNPTCDFPGTPCSSHSPEHLYAGYSGPRLIPRAAFSPSPRLGDVWSIPRDPCSSHSPGHPCAGYSGPSLIPRAAFSPSFRIGDVRNHVAATVRSICMPAIAPRTSYLWRLSLRPSESVVRGDTTRIQITPGQDRTGDLQHVRLTS